MEHLSHFRSLDELIRALERERRLIHALFQDRKRLSFRYDLARELASKRDESIDFLRRFGVIRSNADFLELEDVYLRFFEEVLEVNEEISVASVKESIESLNNASTTIGVNLTLGESMAICVMLNACFETLLSPH